MKKVEKPWGEEIWIAHDNKKYAGKIIGVEAGHKLSKQYHEKKHETLFLLHGLAKIDIDGEITTVSEKDSTEQKIFVIEPDTEHRIEAISECVWIEFSSPELEDVIRLEDDYDRI